jgi:hypothetical protein
VFTNEGTGTLIVADTKALSPAEQTPQMIPQKIPQQNSQK